MPNGIEIKDIPQESGSDSSAYGNISWKRQGDLICVTINPASIVTSEWRILGTLPVGLRPSQYLYNTAWINPATGDFTKVLIREKNDENAGAVMVQGNIASSSTLTFTI